MSFDDEGRTDGQRLDDGTGDLRVEVTVAAFGKMPNFVQGHRTERRITQRIVGNGNQTQVLSALVHAFSELRTQPRDEEETLRLTLEKASEGILTSDVLCLNLTVAAIQNSERSPCQGAPALLRSHENLSTGGSAKQVSGGRNLRVPATDEVCKLRKHEPVPGDLDG